MKQIITDELWNVIENCIPIKRKKVGRPETDRKKVLEAIAYVLKNGSCWHMLPKELGKPSTIHHIFMKWTRAGIITKIFEKIRALYRIKNKENIWYAIDSQSKKAPFLKGSGRNPTDRGKKGIKQTMIVDRKGMPMHLFLSAANIHDSKLLKHVLVDWKQEHTLTILAADSAYDANELRAICKQKNIALIAVTNPRGNKSLKTTKVPHRWVIERTFGWFSWYRSLKTCWAKLFISHLSFLQLASSIQLFRSL